MIESAPCKGFSQFRVNTMLELCASCSHTQECRQLAADAPFTMTANSPQVWGGALCFLTRPTSFLLLADTSGTATEAIAVKLALASGGRALAALLTPTFAD